MEKGITEKIVTATYAEAWNRLDSTLLEKILDYKIEYFIKKAGASIRGKNNVLKYLQHNMDKIKKAPLRYAIYAEIGKDIDDKKCTLLAQGGIDKIISTIYFSISNEKVKKIVVDEYNPHMIIWRSGNYPGLKPVTSSDNEDKVDPNFDSIKERFLEDNPRFKKRKEKNLIIATVLGLIIPGLGLFYISMKQGIYNLVAILLLVMIYTFHISGSLNFNHFFYFLWGTNLISWAIRFGSAIWGYFATMYNNSTL